MDSVEVIGSKILIRELTLDDQEAASALAEYEEAEWPSVVRQGLRVGLILRRQVGTVANVDFVRLEFERLRGQIEAYWKEHVVQKLNETVTNYFDLEKGAVPQLLTQYFGGGRDQGRLAALFDERNTESVTYKLRKILDEELTGDSSRFVAALNPEDEAAPMGKLRKKIEDRIVELRDKVVGRKAAEEVAEAGTQKGGPYEDLTFGYIDRIAAVFGDKAEDVSNQNVPGDYVVTLDSETVPGYRIRLAIDAKDKGMGLKECEDTLRSEKARWEAQAALLVFARQEQTPFDPPVGLRKLGEGYICVFDKEDLDARIMQAAYQISRLEAVRAVQRGIVQIDPAVVQEKLEQAVQKLQEFVTLKRKLTTAIKDLGAVRQFVSDLHSDFQLRLEEAWSAVGIRAPMPTVPEGE